MKKTIFIIFKKRKRFFFQAEDGIRDQPRSRGLGDVYKRQGYIWTEKVFIKVSNNAFKVQLTIPIFYADFKYVKILKIHPSVQKL